MPMVYIRRLTVALTDGLTYPRTDIWKGKSRNAPETPPMEVKNDITNATRGGIQNATFIPAVSKNIVSSIQFQHTNSRNYIGPNCDKSSDPRDWQKIGIISANSP